MFKSDFEGVPLDDLIKALFLPDAEVNVFVAGQALSCALIFGERRQSGKHRFAWSVL